MVRTQVQLTGQQIGELRKLSLSTGRSVADLVRQGVDSLLQAKSTSRPALQVERALRIAGKFSSGSTDVSTHHDRYFAESISPMNVFVDTSAIYAVFDRGSIRGPA